MIRIGGSFAGSATAVDAERGDEALTRIERPLRIALVASPAIALPPAGYAGTERIVTSLAMGLHARGHEVTVYASGDSELPCQVVAVTPRSVWSAGHQGDITHFGSLSALRAWADAGRFDVIHSHVEAAGFAMAAHCATPVVTTMHSRVDTGGVAELIDEMPGIALVAVSDSQRRWHPEANWVATIHHGLDFSDVPVRTEAGDYLALVGRVSPEKGVEEAIEVARRTRHRLVMGAKVREPEEHRLFQAVVQPAVESGIVDWRGELDAAARDRVLAGAAATLMLGGWPEPFGLVATESMAAGTPVIARRAGAYTETIIHGDTGFLVDDLKEAVFAVSRIDRLDRAHISAYARERFHVDRMVEAYEGVYQRLAAGRQPTRKRQPHRAPVAAVS